MIFSDRFNEIVLLLLPSGDSCAISSDMDKTVVVVLQVHGGSDRGWIVVDDDDDDDEDDDRRDTDGSFRCGTIVKLSTTIITSIILVRRKATIQRRA